MIKIDWKDKRWRGKKGSQLFEELCYELLKFEGYFNPEWRKGSSDGGCDIQAEKIITEEIDGTRHLSKYWFQCKMYSSGIGLNNISSAILQASNQEINYFILMSPTHVTPQLQDFLDQSNKDHKYKFRIIALCGKNFEEKVFKYSDDLSISNKYFDLDKNSSAKGNPKRNISESSVNSKRDKQISPFSKAEEREFNHFEKNFDMNVILDVALTDGKLEFIHYRIVEKLELSISLIDLLVTWFRITAGKYTIELGLNELSTLNKIYIDIENLLKGELNRKKLQISSIKLKDFPFIELKGAKLIANRKNFDDSIEFTRKMFRFYYWLSFRGMVKTKLDYKFNRRIEYEKQKVNNTL